LQRLAWSGACDSLVEIDGTPIDPDVDLRRPALWTAGAVPRAARGEDGAQLALPLDGSPTPPLPALGPWDRVVADYRTTGMTLDKHPMELIRTGLSSEVLSSVGIKRTRHGARVKVAGMVVARQRPATANGVVFMLLEDERGTINLIVSPPVVERCRLAVRTSGFVLAAGKLEHREGTTNVVVSMIERLTPTDLPLVKTRELEAPVGARVRDSATRSMETGRWPAEAESDPGHRPALAGPSAVGLSKRGFDGVREAAMAELAASLPAPHSFGRRGR
jgi:error-prone DNA polymerase